MNIVFFAHPDSLGHQSMPRFARMLAEGMMERKHKVEIWSPQAKFFRLPGTVTIRKWMGYIDQYILFPQEVRKRLKACSADTLFVFTDHALGPWIPLVAHLPHVIHCHDFLAQLSALNYSPENVMGWSGRQYQALIRRGYSQGKHFISVSEKTRNDLHKFLTSNPLSSEIVYNGLNQAFEPYSPSESRNILTKVAGFDLASGYLLHVGGNQWYKNRLGVIEIYNAWRSKGGTNLPLLFIGEQPDYMLLKKQIESPYNTDIYFLSGMEDKYVRRAYSGASVLLFPSLAEGFGWPIAEAMASGCPVITTNEAPMTEVAANAGFLIPRRPCNESLIMTWAEQAATILNKVIELTPAEREAIIKAGFENVKRFNANLALDRIETIYKKVIQA